MAEPATESVFIRDFQGLATRPDSDDLQGGSAVAQVNLMSNRPGLLRVRPGHLPVVFEEQ